ncbi:MAG: DNA-processing protein DprA, partial [Myxococcales bacterium]|nr:DNA-processing protein DprA [Myxococcales bacterium]
MPVGWLRVLGHLPAAPGLAIVGARGADPYGLELAGRVARAAAERGVSVISGGAFGVDAAAHEAALAAGGHTTVVLGSGLDRPAPATHRGLFRRVLAAGGAVTSPFPCGQGAARWTFPRRNPWIAGLARAVVVVQAGLASGTL